MPVKTPPSSKQIRVPVALEHHIRAYLSYLKSQDQIPPPPDFSELCALRDRCERLEAVVAGWEEVNSIRRTLEGLQRQINEEGVG